MIRRQGRRRKSVQRRLPTRQLRFSRFTSLKGKLEAAKQSMTEQQEAVRKCGDKLQETPAKRDCEELPVEIEKVERAIEEAKEELGKLGDELTDVKAELKSMDGSAAAAEAAEEMQHQVAVINDGVERYVRARLARTMLKNEIERYRQQNQGPIMQKASEFFSKMTLNGFASLQTDYNEKDALEIVGVRSSGERLNVAGMSDGTRDQLYLSLRLAALEQYIRTNEPIPLIVDDILINFDDERAKATLNIFEEMSDNTQILFFTHHARLVELAEEGSSDRVFLNGLSA
jgi:uncharacterized protein YhaN